jgi:hypothetical protein
MSCVYHSNDPDGALRLVRRNTASLRAFRRVILEPECVVVADINGDEVRVEGIGWETEGIARMLNGLGASFDPSGVNTPPISGTRKEFSIVRADPWGQDRDL